MNRRALLLPAVALAFLPGRATAQTLVMVDIASLIAGDHSVSVFTPSPVARLHWEGTPRLNIRQDGGEIVVDFDRRLGEEAMQRFVSVAGNRLASADWGFDTLVLRSAEGWTMAAEATGADLLVRFIPMQSDGNAVPEADSAEDKLLSAQADLAAGYPGRASRSLKALHAAHPDDRAVSVALAEADLASGNALAAANRYRLLRERAEDSDPPLEKAAMRAYRAAGGIVEVDTTVRQSPTFDQQDAAVRLIQPLGGRHVAEVGVRHVSTQASEIVTNAGIIRDGKTNSMIISLGGRSGLGDDIRLQYAMSILNDLDLLGLSVAGTFGPAEGRMSARLSWHVPDVVTAEGAHNKGWIDRVAVGGQYRPVPGLLMRGEAGLQRYGLKGEGVRASSVALEGGVEYIVRRSEPYLALSYRLDAEYILAKQLRASGLPFLPLGNRENHSFEALASVSLGTDVGLTVVGGWTIDRFAGGGPSGSVGMNVWPGGKWELSLLGGVSSTTRPGVMSDQFGYGRVVLVHRSGR